MDREAEELLDGLLVELGAYDAEQSGSGGRALPDLGLSGGEIEVDPVSAGAFDYALRAKDRAEARAVVQSFELFPDLFFAVAFGGLSAPAREHLVGIVLAVVMMVVVMVMMMAVLVLMVVMMLMLVIVIVVIIVVIVMIMMMVLMVMMLMLMIIIVFVLFLFELLHVLLDEGPEALEEGVSSVDRLEDLHSAELVPGSGDDDGFPVVFAQQSDRLAHLCLGQNACAAQDYAVGGFYLVVEELAEVLHVHFALAGVHDSGEAAELELAVVGRHDRRRDLGELSDSGGLDHYAVGSVVADYHLQSFLEVSGERAAYAARVHLVDLDSRVLKETAVYSYLAEFVFDDHYLLSPCRLRLRACG